MFNAKKDGAFQEPEEVKRKQDNAWVEAEFARRIIDGAWQEVWSNDFLLDLLANTLSTGDGSGGSFESGMQYASSKGDGGSLTYAATKSFYNPTLSFLYDINCYYNGNTVPGGDIYAYGVKADGTVEEVLIVGSANTSAKTQASYTFTGGSYTKIGFRFKSANWGSSVNAFYWAQICEVTIDGKKCVFDPADNFNFN